MSKTYGASYLTFYDPVDEIPYEILVSWSYYYSPATMYRSNGDPGDPEESELDWKCELISINDVPVVLGTEVPDWITAEMIEEEIDLNDCYD